MIRLAATHACLHAVEWRFPGSGVAGRMAQALEFIENIKRYPCPFCGGEHENPTMIAALADQAAVAFDVPGIGQVTAERLELEGDEQSDAVISKESNQRTTLEKGKATSAQRQEYVRRCERIGLSPEPQMHSSMADAAAGQADSIKRLTILTEVMTGKALHFDPIEATYGRAAPVPQWLHQSRRRP